MDASLAELVTEAFALDLHATIRAAAKTPDEKAFRHTMFLEGPVLVCASALPKSDVMQLPGLTDEFAAQLKTFNLIGVATNNTDLLEFFFLGGMNKPFTSLEKPSEVGKMLRREELMGFMQTYFKLRGIHLNLGEMTKDEFVQAVQEQVFNTTSLAEMSKVDAQVLKLLQEMDEKGEG